MAKALISADLVPLEGTFQTAALVRGEPSLPAEFRWPRAEGDEWLPVHRVCDTWRSTKNDRGEAYLKRHYFEFETSHGRRAVVYFERQARRGEARWRLYTLEAGEGSLAGPVVGAAEGASLAPPAGAEFDGCGCAGGTSKRS